MFLGRNLDSRPNDRSFLAASDRPTGTILNVLKSVEVTYLCLIYKCPSVRPPSFPHEHGQAGRAWGRGTHPPRATARVRERGTRLANCRENCRLRRPQCRSRVRLVHCTYIASVVDKNHVLDCRERARERSDGSITDGRAQLRSLRVADDDNVFPFNVTDGGGGMQQLGMFCSAVARRRRCHSAKRWRVAMQFFSGNDPR